MNADGHTLNERGKVMHIPPETKATRVSINPERVAEGRGIWTRQDFFAPVHNPFGVGVVVVRDPG